MNLNKNVCNCMRITNGAIKDAVNSGAETLAQVQEITKAGTVCGTCKENIQHLIDEFISDKNNDI